MNCPACSATLKQKTVSALTVDVCEGGCGGIWFDWLELKKVDESQEHLGEALLNIVRDPARKVDRERRRNCPRCGTTVLQRHFFSVKRQVEVDECPKCAGYWLDVGELAKIRSEFPAEEKRKAAARALFDEMFDKELDGLRKQSAETEEKAKRIARMFRFISPSYYIPGKQKWGAF
jgi:Zn-finger nucleic acid-binding protein